MKLAFPLRFVVPAPVVGFAPATMKLTGASEILLPSASLRCALTVCGVPIGLVADAGDTESLKFTGVAPGMQFDGPAIVEQNDTTTVVEPGMVTRVDAFGNLLVEVK